VTLYGAHRSRIHRGAQVDGRPTVTTPEVQNASAGSPPKRPSHVVDIRAFRRKVGAATGGSKHVTHSGALGEPIGRTLHAGRRSDKDHGDGPNKLRHA
jgi:hypothetical protein